VTLSDYIIQLLRRADFLQKLMTPIPPNAELFVGQAGYPAKLTMPFALDAINVISNESSTGWSTLPT